MTSKIANNKVCTCDSSKKNIVLLDVVHLKNHELESLDEFYCTSCNSFWREP